jgi:hypothetical protein
MSAGQLISLTGGTNLNANAMGITYLTPLSTRFPASSPTNVPPDHTGFYRNPLMTTDGYLIASHTSWTMGEQNTGSDTFPGSRYDFRLKFLQLSNGFYVAGSKLTAGLTNRAAYWTPDSLVTQTKVLWELDPVEVVSRTRPAKLVAQMAAPERAAFAAADVDMDVFQDYLRMHELALIVSRDVTTRDHADHQQPSRVGSPNESVTVRDVFGMEAQPARFLRVNVTRP